MICPMMSRPVKEKDSLRELDYTEICYVDCQKENCALWVITGVTIVNDHCGLIEGV